MSNRPRVLIIAPAAFSARLVEVMSPLWDEGIDLHIQVAPSATFIEETMTRMKALEEAKKQNLQGE